MKEQRQLFGALVGMALVGVVYAVVHGRSASASPPATASAPPSPEAPVAEVVVRTIAPDVELTGFLSAVESVALRARISGVVESVFVPEGGLVRPGQVLFRLDARPFRIALDGARAELRSAEQRYALSEHEQSRGRRLATDSVIAESELDVLDATAAQSAAAVEAARANVRARALELEYTRVRSPIAGRIGEALVKPGNLVSGGTDASTLLANIVSLDPLHVSFDVDEPTYLSLANARREADGRLAGVPVAVGLSGEEGYPRTATLDYLDPALDAESGTARARAVLPNPDHRLGPGLFVRVHVPTGAPRDTILIADTTVRTDAQGRYVLVVNGEGVVEARHVRLGALVDGLRVVTEGLTRGDRVVVGGMVGPGMTIRPRVVSTPGTARTARRAS